MKDYSFKDYFIRVGTVIGICVLILILNGTWPLKPGMWLIILSVAFVFNALVSPDVFKRAYSYIRNKWL